MCWFLVGLDTTTEEFFWRKQEYHSKTVAQKKFYSRETNVTGLWQLKQRELYYNGGLLTVRMITLYYFLWKFVIFLLKQRLMFLCIESCRPWCWTRQPPFCSVAVITSWSSHPLEECLFGEYYMKSPLKPVLLSTNIRPPFSLKVLYFINDAKCQWRSFSTGTRKE